jgi:hypothetical protein
VATRIVLAFTCRPKVIKKIDIARNVKVRISGIVRVLVEMNLLYLKNIAIAAYDSSKKTLQKKRGLSSI